MTGWIPITSLDDPRVADYRDQKDAWLRVQADPSATGLPAGRFMAEGELVVASLLRSRHRARSILGTRHRLEALVQRAGPIPRETPVYVADQNLMDRIAGFPIHRGLLSCGQAAPTHTLDELLADTRTLVVLEDLSNHDNVGGIFRNVAALGGASAAILLSPRCCDPLYRKAIRVSMGHALHVPFARSSDWPGDLDRLSRAGFRTIALTPDPAAEILRPAPAERVAILVGAEGPGLTPEALAKADATARIPMALGVESLNASVSLALALDRLRRAWAGFQPTRPHLNGRRG